MKKDGEQRSGMQGAQPLRSRSAEVAKCQLPERLQTALWAVILSTEAVKSRRPEVSVKQKKDVPCRSSRAAALQNPAKVRCICTAPEQKGHKKEDPVRKKILHKRHLPRKERWLAKRGGRNARGSTRCTALSQSRMGISGHDCDEKGADDRRQNFLEQESCSETYNFAVFAAASPLQGSPVQHTWSACAHAQTKHIDQ